MSSLMVRPSSRITSCICSAMSGGREKVMTFRVVGILSTCFLLYDKVILYVMKNQRGIGKTIRNHLPDPVGKLGLVGDHSGV